MVRERAHAFEGQRDKDRIGRASLILWRLVVRLGASECSHSPDPRDSRWFLTPPPPFPPVSFARYTPSRKLGSLDPMHTAAIRNSVKVRRKCCSRISVAAILFIFFSFFLFSSRLSMYLFLSFRDVFADVWRLDEGVVVRKSFIVFRKRSSNLRSCCQVSRCKNPPRCGSSSKEVRIQRNLESDQGKPPRRRQTSDIVGCSGDTLLLLLLHRDSGSSWSAWLCPGSEKKKKSRCRSAPPKDNPRRDGGGTYLLAPSYAYGAARRGVQPL